MASKKEASPKPTTARKKIKISEEDIRTRAEKIYLERIARGANGDHLTDWLQAEKEIVEAQK